MNTPHQITPEPAWQQFLAQQCARTPVNGIVTSIVPFGAFVKLHDGVEGLLHRSEWSAEPERSPRAREAARPYPLHRAHGESPWFARAYCENPRAARFTWSMQAPTVTKGGTETRRARYGSDVLPVRRRRRRCPG